MKAIQYFSQQYLDRCRNLSTEQIIKYLDDFRLLQSRSGNSGSKLISIKVQRELLEAFKIRAKLEGVPYQTRIKQLMQDWLMDPETE